MGHSSHNLIRFSSPTFSWRDWGKLPKSSVYRSQYPGCDLNAVTGEHEAGVLPSWEWHSISSKQSLILRGD